MGVDFTRPTGWRRVRRCSLAAVVNPSPWYTSPWSTASVTGCTAFLLLRHQKFGPESPASPRRPAYRPTPRGRRAQSILARQDSAQSSPPTARQKMSRLRVPKAVVSMGTKAFAATSLHAFQTQSSHCFQMHRVSKTFVEGKKCRGAWTWWGGIHILVHHLHRLHLTVLRAQ